MVSLAHGEGFGRPLLEFSLTGKPIIASGWSGQIDFLQKEYTSLLNGELKTIHPSTIQENILIKDSKWFYPHSNHVNFLLFDVFQNYQKYKNNAKLQKEFSKENFSFEIMKNQIQDIFKNHMPNFPKKLEINLAGLEEIKMPKKEKVNG